MRVGLGLGLGIQVTVGTRIGVGVGHACPLGDVYGMHTRRYVLLGLGLG